jgi:hypothetical protein
MRIPLAALWSVRFSSDLGIHRGGVVVIEDGKILGGDSGFTYIGQLRTKRRQMIANMRVAKYVVGAPPIFGMDNFEVELTAQPDENQMSFTGFVVGLPQSTISIDMVRRAELP